MTTLNAHPAPIRVLKFMTTLYRGGTEGQVLSLTRSMDRSRFDVQLGCLRKYGDMLADFEDLNIPITEYPVKSLYPQHAVLQQVKFAHYLRRNKIQIVHCYNFDANYFCIPAAKLAGVPLIIASIRDRGVYLDSVKRRAQKLVCRMADKILVNAESIQDWLLEEGYQKNKINIIKNGIDLSRFSMPRKDGGLRRELGLAPQARLVLLMARLNPQKGGEEFIRAAALLKNRHPDAHFSLVGGFSSFGVDTFPDIQQYRVKLKQLAANLGVEESVSFIDHRQDTDQIVMESDISVLPSHSEGLSNTLLESMAAGKPIVATDIGGNPELIEDQRNGFLVPVQDPQKLAAAIGDLLDKPDLIQRFGQQSRSIAEREYALDKMVARTQELYERELSQALGTVALVSQS